MKVYLDVLCNAICYSFSDLNQLTNSVLDYNNSDTEEFEPENEYFLANRQKNVAQKCILSEKKPLLSHLMPLLSP